MALHLAAALACTAAAVVMVSGARSPVVRRAHVLVVLVMGVLVLAMHSLAVTLACAAALVVTAVVLLLRGRRDREAQACAVDLAVCGGLTMLMGVPLLLAAAGHAAAPAPHEHGLHAELHAAIPGGADHQVLLVALALALVAGWAWIRGHQPPERQARRRGSSAAPWTMMLAMLAMVAT
jgi:hypothetical protein